MKIAICYKGLFNINYVRQNGIDDNLLKSAKDAIENHKEFIYSDLQTNEINTFISSYKTNSILDNIFIEELNAKDFIFFQPENVYANTWMAQLYHLKNIIKMIKNEEHVSNLKYDFFIFTRLDVTFHKNFNNLNIDFNKFNITVEHPSKNCDDNFWIFPRTMLDIFDQSIDLLISESKMTHEINHKLLMFGAEINYIDQLIDSYMGHTIFSFIR